MNKQKAIIVAAKELTNGGTKTNEGFEKLNEYLEKGWQVASTAPMGGAGDSNFAFALVIIEK